MRNGRGYIVESKMVLRRKPKKVLAEELKITRQQLDNWLKSFPDNLKWKDIKRMAILLDVDALDLLREAEESKV